MKTSIEPIIFSKEIKGLGTISLRSFDLDKDIDILYSWVTKPYAKYWGMLEQSKDEVYKGYEEIDQNLFHHAYIGELNGEPIFLMERYKASEDILADYYEAEMNDFGMHILVAPAQKRIPQFTWYIFSTIMEYFFSLPYVERVVVEPDVNNEKIHILNKKAGFVYQKEIQLPQKTAALAICTREDYTKALKNLFNKNESDS